MMGSPFARVSSFVLGLVLATVCLAEAAAAEDQRAFFKDKTVRFVVGYGTGGGYDAYARMLAPHLAKALGATVIVENQPGAGGVTALNRVYSAEPDGLHLMIVNGTAAILSQLLGQQNVSYDLTKMGNLGIISSSPWIWIASPKYPLDKAGDFLKPGLKVSWAAAGQIDGLGDGAALTCEALKLDCKIVRGYDGSSSAALAVTRGEMDALYVSDTSANNYVKSNSAKPIATMGRGKSRFFPNLATIFEQVKLSEEQQWWFDFRAILDDLGRILVVPPGLPKERLAFLQDAVRQVLSDPEVVAMGEKSQRYIDYQNPEITGKKIGSILGSITPAQKKRVQEVILKE